MAEPAPRAVDGERDVEGNRAQERGRLATPPQPSAFAPDDTNVPPTGEPAAGAVEPVAATSADVEPGAGSVDVEPGAGSAEGAPDAAAEVEPHARSADVAPVDPATRPARRSADGAAVLLDGVTRRFDDHVAVDEISLTIEPGTILGLIGPSGAGKTTTVRLLTGAIAPSSGTVRVLGEDPVRFRRETRERIGYMPQLFTLYPDLTAGENVDFVASLFGMLWFRRRRRVREVLQLVDLWDARGRRASQLSGGMQRRLELACALVHEPTLLFLDEPTAGIDPLLRASVWDELTRLKEAGRTLLVTTQYVNEAENCDMVALISDGHLIALDTPDDLRRRATGGDVIEVETTRAFDAVQLVSLERVRHVTQDGPRSFRVTVEEAGVATPIVVDAITEAGSEVAFAREYRPSFDEVFGTLVAADRERRGITNGNEAANGNGNGHGRVNGHQEARR